MSMGETQAFMAIETVQFARIARCSTQLAQK